ncbi:hypothetical protein [Amycolatopsis sp. H20-H5]|uniref:hypothetical protein n=1 Tax=Amycolatopsis sp. H20-H5 TaxID=3046309 RepID=UPI002DBA5FAB|nr:hypothetical protein [Amycolatopsis sp. H20-H5]MEC3977788.1 hypothetical protein [Amycolatopsis sp. H20-H5]
MKATFAALDAVKVAHVHMGDETEVRIFVDKDGVVQGSAISLKNGKVPNQKQVDAAVDALRNDASMRAKQTESARERCMNEWGDAGKRRVPDLDKLIAELKKSPN